MLPIATQRRFSLALLLGLPVVAALLLGLYAWRSPNSRFLLPAPGAEWILYPVPPRASALAGAIDQHAVFRRKFELSTVPGSAQLSVRAFKSCSVTLNSVPVELPQSRYLNQALHAEVSAALRTGENEIVVEVVNDLGPPVLWLVLEGPGLTLPSNQEWTVSLDGATELPADLASRTLTPRPGHGAANEVGTLESIRAVFPLLLIFAAAIGAALLVAGLVQDGERRIGIWGYALSPSSFGLLAASLLWALWFSHNTFSVPLFQSGFDAQWHLNYIRYLQDNRTLPLADAGWEMHQPPLYYLLTAGLLSLCGIAASHPSALVILRLFGLATGLASLALVTASLRLLFPGSQRRQLAGLVLAAFLPVHLYLSLHITNEALLTTLVTAGMYVTLRIMAQEEASLSSYSLLGLLLGGALLTKITALVVAGTVVLVLAGRLIVHGQRSLMAWVRSLGVVLVLALLVSGWHYVRVWAHFGTPLVGNYDSASGYVFWMDPGRCDISFLTRFGRCLTYPYYSGLRGLLDSFYTTAFGDGLCGGAGSWQFRPPWNYQLMAAGYLLALLPGFAMLVGLIWALIRLVRRPSPEWFLLLGVVAGMATATLFQLLRYPYYAHGKAFYELSCLLPLCALGAVGLDLLAGHSKIRALVVAVLLGTWATTAYVSFWIRPQSADALNWAGVQFNAFKQPAKAEECFRNAVKADPHHVPARLNLVGRLVSTGHIDKAQELIREVLRGAPNNPEALWGLGALLAKDGQLTEAHDCLRQACISAPDSQLAFSALGGVLLRLHRFSEAISAYREALRIDPTSSPSDHANLGLALARTGHVEESIAQYRRALGLRPDQARWRAHLAWLLANQAQGTNERSLEALGDAREASAATQHADPVCLQALAGVLAAVGQYPEAATTARQAAQLAASEGQVELLQRLQTERGAYVRGKTLDAPIPPQDSPYTIILPPFAIKKDDQ
jgi:tetratricopeptide (TPR) repeat protein